MFVKCVAIKQEVRLLILWLCERTDHLQSSVEICLLPLLSLIQIFVGCGQG